MARLAAKANIRSSAKYFGIFWDYEDRNYRELCSICSPYMSIIILVLVLVLLDLH